MKKRLFCGFSVTVAIAAITFNGIVKSNTTVTDFTELKAKASCCICIRYGNDECETPRYVYSNSILVCGGE
jgi:hypothetical protein